MYDPMTTGAIGLTALGVPTFMVGQGRLPYQLQSTAPEFPLLGPGLHQLPVTRRQPVSQAQPWAAAAATLGRRVPVTQQPITLYRYVLRPDFFNIQSISAPPGPEYLEGGQGVPASSFWSEWMSKPQLCQRLLNLSSQGKIQLEWAYVYPPFAAGNMHAGGRQDGTVGGFRDVFGCRTRGLAVAGNPIDYYRDDMRMGAGPMRTMGAMGASPMRRYARGQY